jgi:hypothetical protein
MKKILTSFILLAFPILLYSQEDATEENLYLWNITHKDSLKNNPYWETETNKLAVFEFGRSRDYAKDVFGSIQKDTAIIVTRMFTSSGKLVHVLTNHDQHQHMFDHFQIDSLFSNDKFLDGFQYRARIVGRKSLPGSISQNYLMQNFGIEKVDYILFYEPPKSVKGKKDKKGRILPVINTPRYSLDRPR